MKQAATRAFSWKVVVFVCLPGNPVARNTLFVEFQFKRNQHFIVTRK
jgi:hypothetical protein